MAALGKEEQQEPERPARARLSQLPGMNAARELVGDIQEEYARVFDEDEIADRRDEVIDMIRGYGNDLNEFLSMSNAAGVECDIWTLDYDEALPLANIWLKRAKRDKRAAAVLRMAMQGDDYRRSIIVLGPRVWRTAGWYPQHQGFRMTPWQPGQGDASGQAQSGPHIIRAESGERGPS